MEGFSRELPNNSIIFALCRERNRGREGGREGGAKGCVQQACLGNALCQSQSAGT